MPNSIFLEIVFFLKHPQHTSIDISGRVLYYKIYKNNDSMQNTYIFFNRKLSYLQKIDNLQNSPPTTV